jgi:hypothetical protein
MVETDTSAEPVDLRASATRKRVDSPLERVKKAQKERHKSILPKPKSLRVRPEQFFKWAFSFTPEQKGRSIFHLYRDYPAIDLRLIGAQKPKLIKQFDGPDPFPFAQDEWQQYVLTNKEWGGSGEYKILCTEMGLPGCLSMTKFTLDDGDYPPCIDLKSLLLGHPLNKGYEAALRAQHIAIPGDDPRRDQEDENMQVGNTVVGVLAEQLTRSNERLMDKLDEAEENEKPDVEEQIEQNSTAAAIQVVAEGAKEAIKLVGDQARQISAAQSPFNPMDFLKEAVPLFRSNGSDTSGMFKMFLESHEKSVAAVQQMHEKTLEFMREQREDHAEQREAAITVANPSGFDSFLEQGQKMKQMAELFGWSTSTRRREPELPEPAQKPWYQAWMENPTLLITGLTLASNIVYNVFNRGQGKPPQEALKEAARETAELAKGVNVNGTVTPIDQAEQQKRAMQAFMELIEPAFIAHYFDREARGLDGFTFAEVFLTMRQTPGGTITFVPDGPATDMGMAQYEAVKAGGMENFDRAIRNYHPIWSLVQGNISKYTTFLKQFFSYQEEAAKAATTQQPN